MRRTIVLVWLLAMVGGCGGGSGNSGGSPTGPSGSGGPTIGSCTNSMNCPPLSNMIGVWIKVQAFNQGNVPGPFSYTLAGLTVSGTGQNSTDFVGFAPGDYEVSGQMQTSGLIFGVLGQGTNIPGGAGPGSVISLQGPLYANAPADTCGVSYFQPPGSGGVTNLPVNFSFKFTISSSVSGGGGSAGPSTRC